MLSAPSPIPWHPSSQPGWTAEYLRCVLELLVYTWPGNKTSGTHNQACRARHDFSVELRFVELLFLLSPLSPNCRA